MRNPYVVGSPVFGDDFYDHETLIEDLLDLRRQCIYLVGNRRMGKTSLLQRVEDQALCVALFLSLQGTGGDPDRMGEALVRRIERKAPRVPPLQDVHLDTHGDICDVVESLTHAAEARGFRVLLLWDEAEVLLRLPDTCLQRLRSVLQDNGRVLRTILAATKRLSELNDRCRSWKTSPFLFGFAVRYMPPLSDQGAVDLIRQINNPEGSVQVGEDLVGQILDVTGNHPYLIQLLCDRLFQSDGSLRPISSRDLAVDESLANVFQIDYNMLSQSEQSIVRALAEQTQANERGLQQSLKLERDDLRSYLRGLEQLGYVRHRDGQYQIASLFLGTWLSIGRFTKTPAVMSDEASLATVKGSDLSDERGLEASTDDLVLVRQLNVVLTPERFKPPAETRVQDLPLNELSWEQFEALCAALIEANPMTVDCHLRGVSGDDQKGIDIAATQRGVDEKDELWAYQCKRYKSFTPSQVEKVLSKIAFQADYHVLMLSIEAGVRLREVADQKPDFFLWDRKDICRKLKNYPGIVEDFFGPAWRKAFCG